VQTQVILQGTIIEYKNQQMSFSSQKETGLKEFEFHGSETQPVRSRYRWCASVSDAELKVISDQDKLRMFIALSLLSKVLSPDTAPSNAWVLAPLFNVKVFEECFATIDSVIELTSIGDQNE